jgi:hypothetical protein
MQTTTRATRYRHHLTPEQAASGLGVTGRQLRRWLAQGRYPGLGVRVGRCWAVNPGAVEALRASGPRLTPPAPLSMDERFPSWTAAAVAACPVAGDSVLWCPATVEQLRHRSQCLDGRPAAALVLDDWAALLWHHVTAWVAAHMHEPARLSDIITAATVARIKGDTVADRFLAYGMARITHE